MANRRTDLIRVGGGWGELHVGEEEVQGATFSSIMLVKKEVEWRPNLGVGGGGRGGVQLEGKIEGG